MAGRNNPLIKWLNISFDTFNLLHRWFGRIVIIEAVVHTLAFLIPNISEKGVAAAFATVTHVPYIMYGFIVSLLHTLSLGSWSANIQRPHVLS